MAAKNCPTRNGFSFGYIYIIRMLLSCCFLCITVYVSLLLLFILYNEYSKTKRRRRSSVPSFFSLYVSSSEWLPALLFVSCFTRDYLFRVNTTRRVELIYVSSLHTSRTQSYYYYFYCKYFS